MSSWDAQGYDRSFSFVTSYGAALLDLLEAQPGERILDVGCGTGHQAAELAARGAHVVGVDADAAMLEVARAEHPEVSFHRADAQDREAMSAVVASVGYDAVLSNAALHWMPRQDDVVAALAEALRPGGRLVVEMGGSGNVRRAHESISAARRDVGLDPDVRSSWTFPTPGEQAVRLERHGFRVRLVSLYDRPTPLNPGDTAADWARMFGAVLVDDVPTASRAAFDHAVDAHASAAGLDRRPDGEPGWWIDYVRLRFVAERL
ncbi:MAG TPA: class I SAM-dependent methyltransferase [Candidatus Nanopelagicales bacterium]|nr:class I SAM-dependent methyltransferase [Candidatus Nanopelagicales bacterium]